MFPSQTQKKGGWGSTSQKNFGGGAANLRNDMEEEEIPFPSRAAKKQGRPATSQMTRQEDENQDMWGQPSGGNVSTQSPLL